MLLAALLAPGDAAATPTRAPGPGPGILVFDQGGLVDVNLLGMRVTNFGPLAFDLNTSSAGLEYPRGTGRTAVFSAGLWLAGMSDGSLRAAVTDYSSEYAPGAIVGGVPDDPEQPAYKVYTLRREYPNPTERDAALADYNAGAVPHGAPPVFVRGDGSLTVIGDQMLWAVYNDADPARHTNVGGSTASLGVEVRQTIYEYDQAGSLGATVFMRFEITNRSPHAITDLHAGVWSDPDLGGFTDDLVGSDPGRDLAYCYNATNNDAIYGTQPPAVGIDLIGGAPVSSGPGLRSNAIIAYINGTDPANVIETYRQLRGLMNDGTSVIDPTTGQPTRYYYPGDPVAATGWLDSSPADRRMMVCSGPLGLLPGGTITLWAAIVIGQGPNRLGSISALRFYDDQVQSFFDAYVAGVDGPGPRTLALNVWPNPGRAFALGFSLGRAGRVRATIHDLQGREVARLADAVLPAGPHVLPWDGRSAGGRAAPGIYWARIVTADGSAVHKIVRLD
jgi:hypothetical protein